MVNVSDGHSQVEPDQELRFFVPGPSSRFFPSVRAYLDDHGVKVEAEGRRLRQQFDGLEILMARGFDIPSYVADGWGDLGITGVDAVQEDGDRCEIVSHLGIRHSTVVFASAKISSLKDLSYGDLIITEYRNLGPAFFEREGVEGLRFHFVTGGAESLAHLPNVRGIVTLKTSGQSLIDNGLEVVEPILETHACLVAARQSRRDRRIEAFIDQLSPRRIAAAS